jgi:hypothetical protein
LGSKSYPSWIFSKCQPLSKSENLKEGGALARVRVLVLVEDELSSTLPSQKGEVEV